jgi:hypothetical protein
VRVPTLGSPKPSHPQIVLDPAGRIVIAWDEVDAGARRAAYTAIGSGGTFGQPRIIGDGTYPVIAAADGGLVAAWTSGPPAQAVIKTRRLP